MARCNYLEYESSGPLFSQGEYYCKLSKKKLSEEEVKRKCNPSYGDEYKNCAVYKNS